VEAPGFWQVYPNADRDEVRKLIELAAAELHIDVPPILNDQVALPPHPARIVAAFDKVMPDWRDRALLSPPSSPPAG
jgi:hypothetical protein